MTALDETSLPLPPCQSCNGACCSLPVEIDGDEVADFPDAVCVPEQCGNRVVDTWMLPRKADGRCVYLDVNNRCRIYERRPRVCREFNCLCGYKLTAQRHSFFLDEHPEVARLIELQYPEWAASR